MPNLLLRLLAYVALASVPVLGAYDYGTSDPSRFNIWVRLGMTLAIAAVITAVGEIVVLLVEKRRRR